MLSITHFIYCVSVPQAFFNRMMTCMDSALCEGWIVPDDFSEPFIQLGMPAIAIIEIALQSRDNIGVTGLRVYVCMHIHTRKHTPSTLRCNLSARQSRRHGLRLAQ